MNDFLNEITDRKNENLKFLNYMKWLKSRSNCLVTDKMLDSIENCRTYIELVADSELKNRKLLKSNSCKNKYCPICSRSAAIKDSIINQICYDYLKQDLNRNFIFLTLTIRAVTADELSTALTKITNAFRNLMKRQEVTNICKGFIKKLEVNYNKKRDFFTPHIHALIAVSKNYDNDKKSKLNRSDWLKHWQECYGDDKITQVDVRKVYTKIKDTDNYNIENAVLEISKYISKSSDYLYSEEIFEIFYKCLYKKNKLTYSGEFREAKRLLKIKDNKIMKYIKNKKVAWKYYFHYYWNMNSDNQYLEKFVLIDDLPENLRNSLINDLKNSDDTCEFLENIISDRLEETEKKEIKKDSNSSKFTPKEIEEILSENQLSFLKKDLQSVEI